MHGKPEREYQYLEHLERISLFLSAKGNNKNKSTENAIWETNKRFQECHRLERET